MHRTPHHATSALVALVCALTVPATTHACPTDLRFQPEPQTSPATVPAPNWTLNLDPARDYVVTLPSTGPRTRTLAINGGNDVRVIGGEIRVSTAGDPAIKATGQTGSLYVEGVKITGPNTGDGILLDQRLGARVTIQNVFVEGVYGSQDGVHADLIQTWAGPRRLEIDRFAGTSNFQGFFLVPNQFGTQPPPELVDMSRVQIDVNPGTYGLWKGGSFPISTFETWVDSDATNADFYLWPKPSTGDLSWSQTKAGTPVFPFVVPDAVGVGYQNAA